MPREKGISFEILSVALATLETFPKFCRPRKQLYFAHSYARPWKGMRATSFNEDTLTTPPGMNGCGIRTLQVRKRGFLNDASIHILAGAFGVISRLRRKERSFFKQNGAAMFGSA